MVFLKNGRLVEQTVTLQILGRQLTFQNETGDPDAPKVAILFEDAVQKVESQFVDKKMRVDRETILILTGLNIASDYYKRKNRYNRLIDRMNKKTILVLNALEKAAL